MVNTVSWNTDSNAGGHQDDWFFYWLLVIKYVLEREL
jgi:hypothetical protein